MINLDIDTAIPKMIAAFNAGTLQFQCEKGLKDGNGCYYRAPWDNNVTCIVGACISEDDFKADIQDVKGDFSQNQQAIGELHYNNVIKVPDGQLGFFNRIQTHHDLATMQGTVEAAKEFFVERFNETMNEYGRPERIG